MFYKQDWILRQIQMIGEMISMAVFHKSTIAYENENIVSPTQTDQLYTKLDSLVAQKKIGEAEDALYDTIDVNNPKHLELALDFYQKLNRLSDEELAECNFPREEIMDGMNTVIELFGLTDLVQ
jgi:hypothetical protein